jgi:hypothetical protein
MRLDHAPLSPVTAGSDGGGEPTATGRLLPTMRSGSGRQLAAPSARPASPAASLAAPTPFGASCPSLPRAPEVFARLFASNHPESVVRFLNDDAGPLDYIRIMCALPTGLFLRALLKTLRS